MKFLKIGLVLSFLTLFVFACSQTKISETAAINNNSVSANSSPAGTTAQPDVDEFAAARKIYSENCVKCHKADGLGGLTVVEGRNIKAPNFTSNRQKREPDSEYIDTIENGAEDDGMPAFKGKIDDNDIKSLVKYIRREFQGK